jgi:hypothetical protein
MSLQLAHSDALRQRSTSVAFGAKRTLIKLRCPAGAEETPGGRAGAPEEKEMGCPPRRKRSCPAAGCTGLLRALPHLPALAADMVKRGEGETRPASHDRG